MVKETQKAKSSRRPSMAFIGAWIPLEMSVAVDAAARALDLDRSKFLRRALKEKIEGR